MQRKLPKIKPRPSKEVFITSTFFSDLKKKYKLKEEQLLTEQKKEPKFELGKELEERENKISSQKQLSDLYANNFSLAFDDLQKDYLESLKVQGDEEKKEENKQKVNKINNNEGFEEFTQTKYVNPNCMLEFYNKYAKFDSLYRKYPLTNKTPSWTFIESSNEEKIIPNPLGLLRRSGQEKKLALSNHKVGDNYMKALGNSLDRKSVV